MNEPTRSAAASTALAGEPVALVDLLDRVLAKGVVVSGDIVISIAEVDLVRISLNAMIASVASQTQVLSHDE